MDNDVDNNDSVLEWYVQIVVNFGSQIERFV